MPQTIEITITEDGEIQSKVKGVLGPDCEGILDFLEELGDVVEHRRTSDYYRRQTTGTGRRLTVGEHG